MAASLPNEPDDLLITDELHHPLPTRRTISAKNWPSKTSRSIWPSSPIRFCHGSSILRWSSVEGSPQGISLYEAQPPGPGIFRWHHLAGRYANFLGRHHGTSRHGSQPPKWGTRPCWSKTPRERHLYKIDPSTKSRSCLSLIVAKP